MSINKLQILLSVGIAVAIVGCAINPQTGQLEIAPSAKSEFTSLFANPNPCSNKDRNIGMVAGFIGGAILGHYLGENRTKTLLGAAIGTGIGALIGYGMDARRCKLYRIAKENHLHLMSAGITLKTLGLAAPSMNIAHQSIGLDVQLRNKSDEFILGTAQLTPQAKKYVGEIANEYTPQVLLAQLPHNASSQQRDAILNRKVLIVGHTGEKDVASGVDLAKLSQKRARAVAEVFEQHGVPARNIEYQGAGDTLPITSNASKPGQRDNARVEIVDVPSLHDLKRYVNLRSVNPIDFNKVAANQSPINKNVHNRMRLSSANTSPIIAPTPQLKHSESPMRSPNISKFRFGGNLLGKGYSVKLGDLPKNHSLLNFFIKSAQAAQPVIVGSCLNDHPRKSTNIRNLATGRVFHTNEAMRGLYGQPWVGRQGSTLVAFLHVYVPKDAAAPVPPVTVDFYPMDGHHVSDTPSAVVQNAAVNVYRGSSAILYRVFVKYPAQCIDLYVRHDVENGSGLLIYRNGGAMYESHGRYISRG